VVEEDDAVGDILLEAVAGERAVAALGGDDSGEAAVFQPAEKTAQLGAQDRLFGSEEKSVSRVSSTIRFAPIVSTASARRMNSPSRSYSPVSVISLRSTWT